MLKVGDSVRCIREYGGNDTAVGKEGKVTVIMGMNTTVEFNEGIWGHSGQDGKGKPVNCWNFPNNDWECYLTLTAQGGTTMATTKGFYEVTKVNIGANQVATVKEWSGVSTSVEAAKIESGLMMPVTGEKAEYTTIFVVKKFDVVAPPEPTMMLAQSV